MRECKTKQEDKGPDFFKAGNVYKGDPMASDAISGLRLCVLNKDDKLP